MDITKARMPKDMPQMRLLGYAEKAVALTITSGTVTADLSEASNFDVTMNANVTTLAFSNVPDYITDGDWLQVTFKFTQDATGNRTITWPANVRSPGGANPALSTGANVTDFITLLSKDRGVNWWVFPSGMNYSA